MEDLLWKAIYGLPGSTRKKDSFFVIAPTIDSALQKAMRWMEESSNPNDVDGSVLLAIRYVSDVITV